VPDGNGHAERVATVMVAVARWSGLAAGEVRSGRRIVPSKVMFALKVSARSPTEDWQVQSAA